MDSKFTVLFAMADVHLAYAWSNQPSTAYYNPLAAYRSTPSTGAIGVTRDSPGYYTVRWGGVDPEIFEDGDVQVTTNGTDAAQCKAMSAGPSDNVTLRCIGPNGAPTDARFTVLYHS